MPEPYPFETILAQLDEIDRWLRSRGFSQHDRIRVYRENIRAMMAAQLSGTLNMGSIPEKKRREIVWSYVEAAEFVRALVPLRACLKDDSSRMPIERALHGPPDLYLENKNNSAGRNFLFELIIGGRFAKAGIAPSFDDGPDVAVRIDGMRVAVQCKRPLSLAGLESCVRKGISQLRQESADVRVIAISVSRLLNPGRVELSALPNAREAQAHLDQKCVDTGQKTKPYAQNKLERGGILFYGYSPLICLSEKGSHQAVILRTEALFSMDESASAKERLRILTTKLGK